ncbi:ketoreductase domain-containing protein [Streptomyces sp. L7]
MTPERLAAVLRPKVDAAWRLRGRRRTCRWPEFVLFSSAAGLLGNPGQASYAAANSFLDALAPASSELGLPALSRWPYRGAWADEEGMALAARSPAQVCGGPVRAGLSGAGVRASSAPYRWAAPNRSWRHLPLDRSPKAAPGRRRYPSACRCAGSLRAEDGPRPACGEHGRRRGAGRRRRILAEPTRGPAPRPGGCRPCGHSSAPRSQAVLGHTEVDAVDRDFAELGLDS